MRGIVPGQGGIRDSAGSSAEPLNAADIHSGLAARTQSARMRRFPGFGSDYKGTTNMSETPRIGLVMGSSSDWDIMQHAASMLDQLGIAYEARVVSAHRTPDLLFDYAATARSRGIACIIAGAGGAAHLPGMLAAKTTVPVLGVPVPSKYLKGMDSLLSIVQMPKGVPVATFAIGEAGAVNAALYAASILAVSDPALAAHLDRLRKDQEQAVLAMSLPPQSDAHLP